MTRKPTPSGKSYQKQSRIIGRVTALPEIEASGEADCPLDSIKIVRSIRALISVASYSCVSGTAAEGRRGRKDGDATWHGRDASSWARRRKIRDRQEVNPTLLARECPPPFMSGPSPRQWTSNRSCRALPGSLLRHSVPPALLLSTSVRPSVSRFWSPHFSVSDTLFSALSRNARRERARKLY